MQKLPRYPGRGGHGFYLTRPAPTRVYLQNYPSRVFIYKPLFLSCLSLSSSLFFFAFLSCRPPLPHIALFLTQPPSSHWFHFLSRPKTLTQPCRSPPSPPVVASFYSTQIKRAPLSLFCSISLFSLLMNRDQAPCFSHENQRPLPPSTTDFSPISM